MRDVRRVVAGAAVCAALVLIGLTHTGRAAGPAASLARWTSVIPLPLVPAGGAVLGTGKVLFWASNQTTAFNTPGNTYSALFDPNTNTATLRNITETMHDFFCTGTSRLMDGRLMVNGGLDPGKTSIYNPFSDTWVTGPTLNVPRGYDASTPLWDGSVMTFGGSWSGNSGTATAEVYTDGGSWKLLPGIPDSTIFMLNGSYQGWPSDGHYGMISTGNGRVLLANPAPNMYWLNPRGTGSYAPAGPRGDDPPAFSGNTVMFEAGKILKVGGSTSAGDGVAASTNAYVIDTTGGTANVTKLPGMVYPRGYHNSVVLPNGQVVVVGGQTNMQQFSDAYAVLAPELFDPQTNTFTALPPMQTARNYHSIALLLPDARVVSAGGGLCNCSADHLNTEILSPPYLFNADGSAATRPAIVSAPTQVGYGTSAAVTTDSPITAFAMVRLGATTHTVNNDQRRVSIPFSAVDSTHYNLSIPTNPGILLPGQWMLFALNANGTPSLASFVVVSNVGSPVVVNPGDLTVNQGSSVNIPVTVSTPAGTLNVTARNLPAGLSINASTGAISGVPTVAGRYVVTVLASNGSQTTSTDVLLDVVAAGTGTGLTAQYFSTATLSGPVTVQRLEVPNFNLSGSASPAPGVPGVNFSTRWTGYVEAVASGVTTFQTTSDDGARVWVNNQLVVDDWKAQAATPSSGIITLLTGQKYPITVEYFQATGNASIQLAWQPPGASAMVPIPVSRLYPGTAPSTSNIALGKTATQSSTYAANTGAAKAVDGNTNGNIANGSVAHTSNSPQEWWQVDLGATKQIDLVQLWNRTDCCAARLSNFEVFVAGYDMTGKTLAQLSTDPTVTQRLIGPNTTMDISPTIGIPIGTQGRFVRVQLIGTDYLQLAEVQVLGGGGFHTPTISPIVSQQSTLGAGVSLQVAANDPDGNPLTYSAFGLPAGVSINSQTGLISGVTTVGSVSNVTVSVSNAGNLSASTSFTWAVLGPIPQVTSFTVPQATQAAPVSYNPSLTAGAATYRWNFGDGSVVTPASGSAAISHTYANAGTFSVTLTIATPDGRTGSYSFVQAVGTGGATSVAPKSSTNLLVSGGKLWVVNQDNDSVSVFDTTTNAFLAEVPVGSGPRSLAVAPDGRIWVVNKKSATISVLSAAPPSVSGTVTLPRASQPFGIVFSPDGSALVTLEALGQVVKLSGSNGGQTGSVAVGPNPRHLAVDSTGTILLVSRYITPQLPGESTAQVTPNAATGGEVVVVNPSNLSLIKTVVLGYSYRPDSENSGSGVPNYLGAPAISPDGKTAWVPSKQDNVTRGTLRSGINLDFKHSVRSISSRIDLTSETEDLASRVDHNLSSLASAATYHPNGVYLFVALEGNRQVAVVDAIGKQELFRVNVGLAPEGLTVSPDGLKLYVNNFMSRNVSVLDLTALINSGQPTAVQSALLNAVTTEKLAPNVLKGKQLFYDAADTRLAKQSYMSCAVCHNDGGHDGRVWDFTGLGEGLRNTISLNGHAGLSEGFLHWSANFDEVQDFEGQIRNFAGGTGLMADSDFNAGTRSQSLGDRKTGLSADLDALAAYMASLNRFPSSPYRNADGTFTAAALAGQTVFATQQCGSCHGGPGFTLSGDATQLKNIGTIKPSSGTRLGGPLSGIDIPTLRDVWSTAPYLHDGSAPTLSSAITAHTGVTLSAADLTNLVEYMKQIGDDQSGMTPVNMSASYNVSAIVNNGAAAAGGGIDSSGDAYSASLLGTSLNALGAPFTFGPVGGPDAASATTVTLPSGNFATLNMIATAVGGNQANQIFVLNYADGSTTPITQSMSDWCGPQSYNFEVVALSMPYRVGPSGASDPRICNAYAYSFPINPAKAVKSVTLPPTRNVVVLAMTLSGATAPVLQPGFTLSASTPQVSIQAGTSGSITVNVTPSNGFNSPVAFSTTGLPNGVTASFSPASSTTASTMTLAVAASAAVASSTVTLTGVSGTLSGSATFTLKVTAAPAPSFTVAAGAAIVQAGASGTSAITITPVNGLSSAVTLSALSWPTGITGSFSPNPTTASSTASIAVGATVKAGQYLLNVGAVSGSLTSNATIALTVKAPAGGGGYPNGYAHRRTLVINHASVSNSTQSNFPLFFTLSDPSFKSVSNGGHVNSASGYDIVFSTDPNGAGTTLSHEIGQYSASAGTFKAWVKVPSLSSTTDTTLYVFYGNPAITASQEKKTTVFDANYVAVVHLPTTQGSTGAGATPAGGGPVGVGVNFSGGVDSFVDLGTASTYDIPGSFTLSTWMKASAYIDNYEVLISKCSGTDCNYELAFDPQHGLEGIQNHSEVRTGIIPTLNQWHYLVETCDGFNTRFYVDGVLLKSIAAATGATIPGTYLAIGREHVAGENFSGQLDEVRVSKAARSADWILTEYRNQSAPLSFYSVSAEQ